MGHEVGVSFSAIGGAWRSSAEAGEEARGGEAAAAGSCSGFSSFTSGGGNRDHVRIVSWFVSLPLIPFRISVDETIKVKILYC